MGEPKDQLIAELLLPSGSCVPTSSNAWSTTCKISITNCTLFTGHRLGAWGWKQPGAVPIWWETATTSGRKTDISKDVLVLLIHLPLQGLPYQISSLYKSEWVASDCHCWLWLSENQAVFSLLYTLPPDMRTPNSKCNWQFTWQCTRQNRSSMLLNCSVGSGTMTAVIIAIYHLNNQILYDSEDGV